MFIKYGRRVGTVCLNVIIILQWNLCNPTPEFFDILYKKSLKIPKGYQNRYIEEEKTTQWPKKKVQKVKQRSTKHTSKTKDLVTRTSPKSGGELRCSRRVSSSCSTGGTHHVNLVTKPVIGHEWGKDREVFTTSGTYSWSFMTQICHNGHGGDSKTIKVMTSTQPRRTLVQSDTFPWSLGVSD